MIAQPFLRVAAGVVVTPETPTASGNFTVSVEPGGKASTSFPGATRAAAAKFWPLNCQAGSLDTSRNMLTLSLDPLTTSSTHPHRYWVCYGGWNTSGLDPEGGTVVGTSRPPVMLAMYNKTPYVLAWQITNGALSEPLDLNTALRLLPGACVALDGAPQPVYYFDSLTTSWRYNTLQAVSGPGSFLHVKALSAAPVYDRTTATPLSGYLEIVVAQATTAYMLP